MKRKHFIAGKTGVYPPFDDEFARTVRANLDALSDEEIDKQIARLEEGDPTMTVITRNNNLATYKAEKRRRQEQYPSVVGRNISMFQPDWTAIWTQKEAEAELNDFRYMGPGFYHTAGGDSMVVMPVARAVEDTWNSAGPDDEKFHFLVYNNRNICEAVNLLVNAPTRS